MTEPITDPILVAEAAELLGVTPGRVHQLITAGHLRSELYGPLRRLSRAEVVTFAKAPRPVGNPNFRTPAPRG